MKPSREQALKNLQVIDIDNVRELDRAYEQTLGRVQGITRQGNLRLYRNDLMKKARDAYFLLKKELDDPPATSSVRLSVVARQAAQRETNNQTKPAVKPQSTGRWFDAVAERTGQTRYHRVPPEKPPTLQPKPITARTVAAQRHTTSAPNVTAKSNIAAQRAATQAKRVAPRGSGLLMNRLEGINNHAQAGRTQSQQSRVEDDFCQAVMMRIEGDVLRFENRLELLVLAEDMRIDRFRANFLMAQIVEAVRSTKSSQKHHSILAKLFHRPPSHSSSTQPSTNDSSSSDAAMAQSPTNKSQTYWLIAITVLSALLLELLTVRLLSS